jgi:hypothetical protein
MEKTLRQNAAHADETAAPIYVAGSRFGIDRDWFMFTRAIFRANIDLESRG